MYAGLVGVLVPQLGRLVFGKCLGFQFISETIEPFDCLVWAVLVTGVALLSVIGILEHCVNSCFGSWGINLGSLSVITKCFGNTKGLWVIPNYAHTTE